MNLPCYAGIGGKKRQKRQVMAKLGDFEFPEVSLTESVDLARRIYEELGGEVRRDGLAVVLDMSPIGGAFGAKIGALRLWNLATGRSIIKLTSDAVRAVNVPDAAPKRPILTKLASSVPLFNELNDRLGDSGVDQRVLTVMLQDITGAEMDDIARRVAMVERIFGGIHALLIENSAQNGDSSAHNRQNALNRNDALPQGWIELRYDDGSLKLRETIENLDVLVGVLEARKRRIPENHR